MSKPNKYSELFNEDMNYEEALYVFYSHTDGLSDDDLDLLKQAFLPVSQAILQAELEQVKI